MSLPPPPDPLDHYRELLLRHFQRNRISPENPDAAFFYGFTDEHLGGFAAAVPTVLQQLGRPFAVVHCAGKTNRQIYAEAARAFGKGVSDKADAYTAARALYDALLNGACTLVLQMLSQSKGTYKPGFARDLIKTLDDAHIKGFRAMSDIIYIDRASFLEKAWPDIGAYLRMVGPFDAGNAWMDNISKESGRPTLVPV
ncbi:MAG: hypothetical protein M0006_00010 [Magnetospirillum sp.]|nr:hypothetical protein [Magnetospirillum sp.]